MGIVMSTVTIRQKLHSYLEVADDKKVKAIYAIMESDIEGSGIAYTDEIKKELDRRHAEYKSGKANMVTADESRKRVQKILKAARKK
jgi:putative addiction module component (TIGR02574 family)